MKRRFFFARLKKRKRLGATSKSDPNQPTAIDLKSSKEEGANGTSGQSPSSSTTSHIFASTFQTILQRNTGEQLVWSEHSNSPKLGGHTIRFFHRGASSVGNVTNKNKSKSSPTSSTSNNSNIIINNNNSNTSGAVTTLDPQSGYYTVHGAAAAAVSEEYRENLSRNPTSGLPYVNINADRKSVV